MPCAVWRAKWNVQLPAWLHGASSKVFANIPHHVWDHVRKLESTVPGSRGEHQRVVLRLFPGIPVRSRLLGSSGLVWIWVGGIPFAVWWKWAKAKARVQTFFPDNFSMQLKVLLSWTSLMQCLGSLGGCRGHRTQHIPVPERKPTPRGGFCAANDEDCDFWWRIGFQAEGEGDTSLSLSLGMALIKPRV